MIHAQRSGTSDVHTTGFQPATPPRSPAASDPWTTGRAASPGAGCPRTSAWSRCCGRGTRGYAAIGIIGFSFAFVIAAAVYVFDPISGAHINPAVTIALAAIRRFPWREVVPYVVAQLGGALGGGLLVL
ncbi:aquaporin [Streptomyces sp. NPDC091412]|uniref:aquaporin n=1 Tax=Streptomyces sp. NPDC091412 TaxID=3366002 RepID=UPI0037FCFFA4